MAIIIQLDRVMADRKISLKDLAEEVGITNVNLSKLKTGKALAIRFQRWKPFVKHSIVNLEICLNMNETIRQYKATSYTTILLK